MTGSNLRLFYRDWSLFACQAFLIAHMLLLCKWSAATLPCHQSTLRAGAGLLSVLGPIMLAYSQGSTGIAERTGRNTSFTSDRMTTNDAIDQTSSIFCNSTMIYPATWTENSNGRSTKAMSHGLTWSWMPFLATTQIWSCVVVLVDEIRMLLLIWRQCPRSPGPPSITRICALNAFWAREPSLASEGTWEGNIIGHMENSDIFFLPDLSYWPMPNFPRTHNTQI